MVDVGMGCLMPSMPYDFESVTHLYLAYHFLEYSLMIEIIIGQLLSKILIVWHRARRNAILYVTFCDVYQYSQITCTFIMIEEGSLDFR
jgi:hypothetical protein